MSGATTPKQRPTTTATHSPSTSGRLSQNTPPTTQSLPSKNPDDLVAELDSFMADVHAVQDAASKQSLHESLQLAHDANQQLQSVNTTLEQTLARKHSIVFGKYANPQMIIKSMQGTYQCGTTLSLASQPHAIYHWDHLSSRGNGNEVQRSPDGTRYARRCVRHKDVSCALAAAVWIPTISRLFHDECAILCPTTISAFIPNSNAAATVITSSVPDIAPRHKDTLAYQTNHIPQLAAAIFTTALLGMCDFMPDANILHNPTAEQLVIVDLDGAFGADHMGREDQLPNLGSYKALPTKFRPVMFHGINRTFPTLLLFLAPNGYQVADIFKHDLNKSNSVDVNTVIQAILDIPYRQRLQLFRQMGKNALDTLSQDESIVADLKKATPSSDPKTKDEIYISKMMLIHNTILFCEEIIRIIDNPNHKAVNKYALFEGNHLSGNATIRENTGFKTDGRQNMGQAHQFHILMNPDHIADALRNPQAKALEHITNELSNLRGG